MYRLPAAAMVHGSSSGPLPEVASERDTLWTGIPHSSRVQPCPPYSRVAATDGMFCDSPTFNNLSLIPRIRTAPPTAALQHMRRQAPALILKRIHEALRPPASKSSVYLLIFIDPLRLPFASTTPCVWFAMTVYDRREFACTGNLPTF